MNLGSRATLKLSKAATENSMFIKLHRKRISTSSLGSKLIFPRLKLHCLQHQFKVDATQIEFAVSCQHWDGGYSPVRGIGKLMMCLPISYTSRTAPLRGKRSNGEPKGITPFQSKTLRLRRMRRTMGSTRLNSDSIVRSLPDGVDGETVVPTGLPSGRVSEFASEKTKDKTWKGLPPITLPSSSKDEKWIATLVSDWNLQEIQARGVEVPRTFTKLANMCLKDKTCKINNIYPLMSNPNIIDIAYHKIKSNPGNMTQGSTHQTLDGWGYESVLELTSKLRNETFQFAKARIVEIPKLDGGKRALKVAPPRDKIVQQAMLFILETIYEPAFSELSFGFRRGTGCHDALFHIKKKFQGTRWFIEGDISKCFDEIDHNILISTLRERIKDEKFIRLIYKALKAGYLDVWTTSQTCLVGTPQGSIISPILCNVFMDSFDSFVENELMPKYTRGVKRSQPKEYKTLISRANYWEKKYKSTQDPRNKEKAMSLRAKAQELPSVDPNDPKFRRLYYIRYADDWLIGFAGPYNEAEEIRTKCKEFLAKKKLRLNSTKTIISRGSEGCIFLGTKIHVPLNEERFKKNSKLKARANLGVRLNVPLLRVISKLQANRFCTADGLPLPKMAFYAAEKNEIIKSYVSVYRGILNYYSFADNYKRLSQTLFSILRNSAAKVLAAKFKLRTVRQTLLKFGKYLGKTKDDVQIPDPKTRSLRGDEFKLRRKS